MGKLVNQLLDDMIENMKTVKNVCDDNSVVENYKLKFLEELREYRNLEQQGLLLRLPCTVGDTVYVICECETIPPQLDGTLYGENGGPGTATGYYCPYEDTCPHECKECEDDFDCDKFKGKPAVFEDSVIAVWHDESGVSIITSNCPLNSRLGEYIFLTKEEAEAALARMEKE